MDDGRSGGEESKNSAERDKDRLDSVEMDAERLGSVETERETVWII